MNYTGNATLGSQFVDTTFDPEPTLREAELIEIGEPVVHITEFEALTIYPPPVQIRIIPFGQNRIRLQNAWPYATAYNQTITRLELGLTRPVINGIANFTDLRINKIGGWWWLRPPKPEQLWTASTTSPATSGDSRRSRTEPCWQGCPRVSASASRSHRLP